jgi:hypothetical protein
MNATDYLNQNLTDAVTGVFTEISRTDTKAATILTLDGILVAGAALMSGRSLPILGFVVAAVGAAAVVASAALALAVVRPRLGGTDQSSFPYWSTLPTDEAVLSSIDGDDKRPARIRVLSGIAMRKMRLLQRATDSAFTAVLCLAIAGLTTAI